MSKWVVNIHGDIEGDYEIIKEYEEPKMGRWIKVDDEEPIAYDCSECGAMVSRRYRYCPECGAKMQEDLV